MMAILNFGETCTDDLNIIKTMGDKLKLTTDITSCNISVSAISCA